MNEYLDVQSLCFSYGDRAILREISFSAPAGEFISLIGPNGSGKSTLLNLLGGFLIPRAGGITLCGSPLSKLSIRARAERMAYVDSGARVNFPFTSEEIVRMGLRPQYAGLSRLTEDQRLAVRHAMEQTGCLNLATQEVTTLSGGEYQRVLLARALVQKPKVLLLDEALSDLDVAARIRILKLLREEAARGMTIVSVEHDLANACRFSDRVLVLSRGALAADGEPQAVITPALLGEVFGVRGLLDPQNGLCIIDITEV